VPSPTLEPWKLQEIPTSIEIHDHPSARSQQQQSPGHDKSVIENCDIANRLRKGL
jgi:hypothetical protein